MVQKTTTATGTATATGTVSASPSDGSGVAQKRSRSRMSSSEDVDAEHEPDIEHNADDDKPKKRRRVVKMADKDKKYGCPAEGCGKSYSRAEHLYRHQLNHTHPASYVHFDNSILDASLLDQLAAGSSMPVFNSESYSHEPQNMGNDFTAWLFNTDPHFVQPSPSPAPLGPGSADPDISLLPRLDIPLSATSEHSATPHPRHPQDPHSLPSAHQIPAPTPPAAHPHPPIPKRITTSTQRESILTSTRVSRLHNLIYTEFVDRHNPASQALRARLLAGDTADPSHVLSQCMLQIHMSSYWLHLHPQIPILHRPTFDASTCPDLLLLTLITLGASCLESSHQYPTTAAGVELSLFLATHIRHLVLKDGDFVPPAKLWVFQSLLLLELYEKMYADRALHERAHVHHATTLTLMRRGSSLIGRAASDYPPACNNNTAVPGNSGSGNGSGSRSRSTRNINDPSSTFGFSPGVKDPEPEPEPESDPTRTPPGPNGSINTSGTNTSDEWWNRWITAEATRRAAFAAFVIDVTHATMFGHSAVMVAHEMRIPLPCDESAWNAGSGAEVKALLAADGKHGGKVKGGGGGQVTFLEGLKKTLSGVPVRTNMFGRVILMAGLLSVSWHMKMQDVRVHSIGVGKQGSWGSQLMHAFDFWKRDFDAALAGMPTTAPVVVPPGLLQQDRNGDGEDCTTHMDNIFESRTVLHHLAHMAMHVDILDCQVFAGATRLLGRVITTQDRAAAQKKMRESWAPTARARDATFYALRFLSAVLMPETVDGRGHGHGYGQGVGKAAGKGAVEFAYSARDDFLLNRPWVLYFATLVVWSYGYALDGPIAPPTYTLSSRENQVHDMQGYLKRVGGVKSPDELLKRKDRNSCLGLLMLLRDMFREARWELLHEASRMLGNCCELLMPGIQGMQGADPSRVSGQPPGAGSPQLQRQSGEAHAALAICESRDARSLDLLHEKKSGKAIVPEALAVGRFACTTWKNLPEEGRRVP
ncbi:hypothetical protein M8818_003195 [Zalaria obscura]|uniref:Uncharacterized protein n=1 Tax=Zalaria obscura TaxID=2024903 RepID=A0ACC3SFV2_9PEZI